MKRALFGAVLVLAMLSLTSMCMAQSKAKAVDEAVAVSDDMTAPRLLEVASPDYTEDAKKHKVEGQVTLMIVIDKKGDVIDVKVVKGLGHGLDENAIAAVKEWKYKPAEKDGTPVVVKMEVTVDYFLPV